MFNKAILFIALLSLLLSADTVVFSQNPAPRIMIAMELGGQNGSILIKVEGNKTQMIQLMASNPTLSPDCLSMAITYPGGWVYASTERLFYINWQPLMEELPSVEYWVEWVYDPDKASVGNYFPWRIHQDVQDEPLQPAVFQYSPLGGNVPWYQESITNNGFAFMVEESFVTVIAPNGTTINFSLPSTPRYFTGCMTN